MRFAEYDDLSENTREVGNYILRRTDPFGFWVILDKNQKLVSAYKDHSFLNPWEAKAFLDTVMKNEEKK